MANRVFDTYKRLRGEGETHEGAVLILAVGFSLPPVDVHRLVRRAKAQSDETNTTLGGHDGT